MDPFEWGTAAVTPPSSFIFSSPFVASGSDTRYATFVTNHVLSSHSSSSSSSSPLSSSPSWNNETTPEEFVDGNKSISVSTVMGFTLQVILNGTGHMEGDEEISTLSSGTTNSEADDISQLMTLPSSITNAIDNGSMIDFTTTASTTPLANSQSTFPGKNVIIPLYTLIFCLSFVGNLMVILTLARNRRMRTVTNVLLLNLAISDLLLGVFCMPVTLIGQLLRNFIFGSAMCRILPYFQAVSVSVGVWTLVAISLERYFAICRPLQSRKWQTRSHAYKMILAVWLFTLTWNLPITFVSTLQPIRNSGRYKCREMWPNEESEKIFNLVLDFLLLVIPLCIMGMAYSLIVSKLWKGLQSEIRHTRSFRQHGPHGHLIPREDSIELSNHSHYSTCKVGTTETGTSTGTRLCVSTNQSREGVSNEIVTLKGGKGVVVRWRRKNATDVAETSNAGSTSGYRLNGAQQRLNPDHHYHHYCNTNSHTHMLGNQNGQRLCQKQHYPHTQPHQSSNQNQESKIVRAIRSTYTGKSMESKKKVIRMLFVLVAEFFVCWTPLYVMNTWYLFDREAVYNHIGPFGVVLIQLLAYVSSCCNPITYCFMNRKYREAFKKIFQCSGSRAVMKAGPQLAGRGSDMSPNDSLIYGAAPSTLNKSVLVLECENRV